MSERYLKQITENPDMVAIKFARYKFVTRMLSEHDEVLEVGCHDGISTNYFSKHCKNICGIDIDTEALAKAKRDFPELDFIDSDALTYQPEKGLDSVVMVDFIEHLTQQDGDSLVKKYAGHLSSRGQMIVGTPSRNFIKYRAKHNLAHHLHEYEPAELKALMEKYFDRVLMFSMNDELVHTGNLNLAWFVFAIGLYPKK